MKKLYIILVLLTISSVGFGQRYFNNNTGNNLWMDAGNWSSGNIGNGSGHKVVIKAGNPIIDGANVQVAQIKIGTAAGLNAVTTISALNGGTLKLTGVDVTAVIVNQNTQAQGGKDIKFDLPLTIHSGQAFESVQILTSNGSASGEAKVIFGSNGSLTLANDTDLKVINVTGSKRVEFNNALTGSDKLIIGASNQVVFGSTFDGSAHSGIIEVLGNNAKLTANVADNGTFVASGNKILTEAASTGVEVCLDGANIYKGDIETRDGALTYKINKNQSGIGAITLGAGNLALVVDDAVTSVAFADNSGSTWGAGNIAITGFKDNVISFGSSAAGLTTSQLAKIDVGSTVYINSSGQISGTSVSQSNFTNAGGDNLWSNAANWSNGIPNVANAKVTLKGSMILDADVTLAQIKLAGGFGDVSVTSNNNSTLTITGEGVTQPIQNNAGDKDLNLNLKVVFNSSDAVETIQASAANACTITFGDASDVTINVPTKLLAQNARKINFNGIVRSTGSGQLQVGNGSEVVFGGSSDNSNYTAGFKMLGKNGLLISNMQTGTFLAANTTIEPDGANDEGHEVCVNGPDTFLGNIKSLDSAITFHVNANQTSAGLLGMGKGNINLVVDTAKVSELAFADNSSQDWGTGKIVISKFKDNIISFGPDAGGLTTDQLAQIDIGAGNVIIDSTGSLVQDSDLDGVADVSDLCPNTPTGETVDANGCSDAQKDTDGDGVTDDIDTCPDTPTGETVDSDGCSDSQKDTDGDGVTDDIDTCPNTPSGVTVDSDGCPIPLFVENVTFIKNVYPNPVKDVLKISLSDNLNVKDIYFVDLAGKILKPADIQKNRRELQVDVSNLNDGMYLLNINTDNQFNKVKVIIER